jgi:hypothetical protein
MAIDVSRERTPSGVPCLWQLTCRGNELRQEFHVPLIASLHFTPNGVSGRRHGFTINIALLTEGIPHHCIVGI